jgi:hypothetical protein
MLARTGKSIDEHQALTTESLLALRAAAPEVPWLPVLQGWAVEDYVRHARRYEQEGVSLAGEARVGVGSVCRRQATRQAADIFVTLSSAGLRLHAFGVKLTGLRRFGASLESADSMAWSFQARKQGVRMEGCAHARCNNCMRWALEWNRTSVGVIADGGLQLVLPMT